MAVCSWGWGAEGISKSYGNVGLSVPVRNVLYVYILVTGHWRADTNVGDGAVAALAVNCPALAIGLRKLLRLLSGTNETILVRLGLGQGLVL